MLDWLRATITNGIAIPQSPGLIYDFLAFGIGFVASIFPSWEPQAFPMPNAAAADVNVNAEQPPAAAAAAAAAAAEGNNNDNNNNNNGPPQVMNMF